MHISFRENEHWDEGPKDVGIHIHGYQINVNPEAENSYLSLEDPCPGALYRLRRVSRAEIARDLIEGGTLVRNASDAVEAIWWSIDDIGGGPFQAIVTDPYKRTLVAYVDFSSDGRIHYLADDPLESVQQLFCDFPREDEGEDTEWPTEAEFGALVASLPTDIA